MKIFIATLTLLIITPLTGCDPYRFTVGERRPIDCRIYSSHNSVDSHLNSFDMHPESSVGMTSLGRTQYEFSSYLNASGGNGFEILLRPILEERVMDSGFVLRFSTNGFELDSGGVVIDANKSFRIPNDSATYITVYNEESYLRVTVGCDTLVKRYTKRKSSDDIVFKTMPGTELRVLSPDWAPMKFMNEYKVTAGAVRQ